MAGIYLSAETNEIALTAATAKTVLQIVAPSNHRLKLTRWGVFFDGATPSAEPVVVELIRQTTAGTMTTLTPVVEVPITETIQSTAYHTATGEPTAGDVLRRREVHPQAGYEYIFPLGQELHIPGGGRLGIRITSPAAVNAIGSLGWEE